MSPQGDGFASAQVSPALPCYRSISIADARGQRTALADFSGRTVYICANGDALSLDRIRDTGQITRQRLDLPVITGRQEIALWIEIPW